MQINDVLHGFRVVRKRENKELGGTLWEFRHVATGAELCWVDNGNENKLFSVAFKTLPWDDTGVFHILEHSVLAGSENFPVKEPFLDLLKSSMNTFLNAMTYPDKTVYPVSSRNEKDFMNLTKVYLDAVFKPAIYTNPNIFYQEGWHYEIRDPEAQPSFKGVVFNEMKGAYSNVSELLDCGIRKLLFPDSVYGFSSGGDPEKIPDLSYEDFLNAHRKFYHPSNARSYLDGAVPLEKTLRLIDEGYIGCCTAGETAADIALQGVTPASFSEETYPIGADESTQNKCQICFGRVLCDWSDRKKQLAFEILATYLTGSNDAPLTKALLEKGLAQNVSLYAEEGIAEPYVCLTVRDTERDRLDEIRKTIREKLTEIAETGIDPEELYANLAQEEYSIRDMEEPSGLIRNLTGLQSWLYGGDIMLYLTHGDVIKAVREEVGTSYFTDLIKEVLLDEAHLSTFVLTPSVTKREETEAKENARLAKAKASWSKEDTAAYIRKNLLLDEWQESEDSEEAKATLPTLSLSDVDPAPVFTPTEVREICGVPLLFHNVASNGVAHVSAYFDVSDVPKEQLSALRFLTLLPGELPTKTHTVSQLQKLRRMNIGDLDLSIGVFPAPDTPEKARIMFIVGVSCLTEKLPAAAAFVNEIMTETDFSDGAKIREILLQEKARVNRSLLSRGNSFALLRAGRTFSAAGAASEALSGFDSYLYLKSFSEAFEDRIGAFTAFAGGTLDSLYVSSRLTLSCTCDDCPQDVRLFIPAKTGNSCTAAFTVCPDPTPKKEAILIPSGVSYAAKAMLADQKTDPYSGTLQVLSSLLSYGYLWGEIRVKGGAYGCGFRASSTGLLSFYSYRDPAPVEAVNVFDRTADYLAQFLESEEDAEKYAISTVSNLEPLLDPAARGETADRLYFTGKTYEDAAKLKREVLSTDKTAIGKRIPLFARVVSEGSVCIVGNETLLRSLDDTWTKYSV